MAYFIFTVTNDIGIGLDWIGLYKIPPFGGGGIKDPRGREGKRGEGKGKRKGAKRKGKMKGKDWERGKLGREKWIGREEEGWEGKRED